MSTTPTWVVTPKSPTVQAVTANTNRDGTGTIVDFYTAGASGGRVDDVKIKAVGTTTAGMIRFYKKSGASYRLIHEVDVSAITPAATTKAFVADLTDMGWILEASGVLAVSTEKTETFNISLMRGGDF